MLKIAITGHRPNKLWGYDIYTPNYIELGRRIKNAILENSVNHSEIELISGMALGVDTIFALIALKLKSKDSRFNLHCAIPCKNHSSNWFGESVKQYNHIIDSADSVQLVSNTDYTPSCMQLRNQYMVNRCDLLIAVWDKSAGGTANCVRYAQEIGKPIVFINPREI